MRRLVVFVFVAAAFGFGFSPKAAADDPFANSENVQAKDFFPGSAVPTAIRERLANRILGRKRAKDPAFDDYYAKVMMRYGQGRDDFLIMTGRDKFVNAFAHFGGIIVMTEGMWQFARKEDEFAAIIAHEMGHIKLRHFTRLREEQKKSSALSVPVLIAGLLAGDGKTRQALVLGSGGIAASHIYAFTREMEHEADTYGLHLIGKNGGNARSLADALSRMESGGEEYLSTHPAISRRVGYLRDRLRNEESADDNNETAAKPADDLDFRLLQNKVMAGEGVVSRLLPVLRANAESDDDNMRTGAHYGMLLLAVKSRDVAAAKDARALLTDIADNPIVAVAFAESYMLEKQPAMAVKTLRDSLDKNPTSAAAAFSLIRTLNRIGDKKQAVMFYEQLPEELQKRPDILMQAATAQTNKVMANLLRARAHFYNGNFEQSARLAKIAAKTAKNPKTAEAVAAIRQAAENELRVLAEQANK
ncbi:MAG: M48 family metalloprotease [Gammaproteobacteria bacterium]